MKEKRKLQSIDDEDIVKLFDEYRRFKLKGPIAGRFLEQCPSLDDCVSLNKRRNEQTNNVDDVDVTESIGKQNAHDLMGQRCGRKR